MSKAIKSIGIILSLTVMLGGCQVAEQKENFKVAVIKFQHETCTFCPGGDVGVDDWTRLKPLMKGDEVLEAGSYINGFVSRARDFEDITLIGITSPEGVFGGSSRSWNTAESFDHFMGIMLKEIEEAMPLDGVYLALHGAMATRNIPRPEAEIAKRVREVVGPDVAIVATFDLHGNEDGVFLEWADGAFTTKRYPHYDSFLQGERAAHYMRQMMRGEYRPTTASRKPGIISPTVVQWTGQSPSMDIMERARRWESRLPDVFVSVFYGFPWSDVPDVGTCIHVMTNNDQHLADSIADDMNEFAWRVREEFINRDYPMPDQAVKRAKAAVEAGAVPVVLGDYSDRPGDATWILKEIVDQGLSNVLYAGLRDEKALETLQSSNARAGDDFDMELGGFTGPQAGKPVQIQGKIKYVGPGWQYNYVAIVEWGDQNLLYITPAYTQILYPERTAFGGVNPDDYEVFVTKSRVHFRRGFDETGYAKTIMVVDAPGSWIGTTRLDALDYEFAPIGQLYPYSGE